MNIATSGGKRRMRMGPSREWEVAAGEVTDRGGEGSRWTGGGSRRGFRLSILQESRIPSGECRVHGKGGIDAEQPIRSGGTRPHGRSGGVRKARARVPHRDDRRAGRKSVVRDRR